MLETDRHTYSDLIRYQRESATFVIRCQKRQEELRTKIDRQTSLTEFTSVGIRGHMGHFGILVVAG
jgi:hypothetical protein